MEYVFIIGVALAVSLFMYIIKILTLPASAMLCLLLSTVIICGSYRIFETLFLIFAIIVLVDLFLGRKSKRITRLINKETGSRGVKQILANCIIAVICIVVYKVTSQEKWIIIFFTAATEVVGDSVASDVGVLSSKNPIDICTFKRMPTGLSGGISLLGSFSSMIACLYGGLIYFFILDSNFNNASIIVLCSLLGTVVDSVLGSLIQAKFQCQECGMILEKKKHCNKKTKLVHGLSGMDNCMVNFCANISSAVFAAIIVFAIL